MLILRKTHSHLEQAKVVEHGPLVISITVNTLYLETLLSYFVITLIQSTIF